jgi:hypothetical protein
VRFSMNQVVKAVIGMAVLIVILERAGGMSLVMQHGASAFGKVFSSLTPAPRGQAGALQRLPRI